MMNTSPALFVLWMVLHFIFASVFLFGFISAILYVFKFADKKDFRTLVWTTLLVGVLGSAITCAVLLQNVTWKGLMMDNFNERMEDRDDS